MHKDKRNLPALKNAEASQRVEHVGIQTSGGECTTESRGPVGVLARHWQSIGIAVGFTVAFISCVAAVSGVPEVRRVLDLNWLPTPTVPIVTRPTATSVPTAVFMPSATFTATSLPLSTLIPYLTVTDEQLYVYSGPGENYDVLGQARMGDRVAILGRSGGGMWWQVNYLGWLGWVPVRSVGAEVDPLAIPVVETPIPPVNRVPEVEIGAASMIIETWGAISVTCEALDPDGDELAYTWEASDGFITGQGDAVTYNAPKTTGGQLITVTVQDRRGEEAKRSVQVHVVLARPPLGTFEPYGVFGQTWWEHLEPHRRLGWANEEECETDGAQQFFERGIMFWRKDKGRIYVITSDGYWQKYAETWEEGMDESSCPDVAPPGGYHIPIRGFGKVWCEQLGASNAEIGWATTPEQAYKAYWQAFEHGLMCQGLDGSIFVLYEDHSWQSYPYPFSGD